MNNIKLLIGDITTAKVDAIVNAANPKMLGGGGVDGAIHRAAGPELLESCRKVKSVDGIRCPFGEARITPAGALDAKYVIHTVGPIYRQLADPQAVLRGAYESALDLAVKHNCKSIAFPAISCGAYGYPLNEAAQVAFEACGKSEYNQLEIWFYLFDKLTKQVWSSTLESMSA